MRVSAKGRYAIRFMIDLAINGNGNPVAIKDIAKRQNISVKYLEQIAAMLNKAYYIKSIRGFKGGYILYHEPENYTVADILKITEGSLAPIDCVGEGSFECDKRGVCVSVRVWERLYNAVNDTLSDITLQDLVDWSNEIDASQYVI